jgi:hypothetical protein
LLAIGCERESFDEANLVFAAAEREEARQRNDRENVVQFHRAMLLPGWALGNRGFSEELPGTGAVDSRCAAVLRARLAQGNVPPVLSPKAIANLTRVLIRDTRTRRGLMFHLALSAVVMVFVGGVVLDTFLRARPIIFLGFWGVCAWLTVSVILLAVFDMLIVRAEGRAARRKLEQELLADHEDHS